MCGILETLLFAVFGFIALVKGEFKITGGRKVRGSVSRALGIALLVGAVAPFITQYGGWIRWGILVVVIIIGLVTSEKI